MREGRNAFAKPKSGSPNRVKERELRVTATHHAPFVANDDVLYPMPRPCKCTSRTRERETSVTKMHVYAEFKSRT